MKETKTSVFSNGLIWFGAAVSIAEILTGTLLAPLGFAKGAAAILLGHVIGCILLYCAGLIGGLSGRSAMETVKFSFGQKGSLFFSVLNITQLVGWTAVMIIGGGAAAQTAAGGSTGIWCVVIGALVLVWILVGLQNLHKLNTVAMSGLFLLTIVLSFVIFRGSAPAGASEGMSFGAAVELSAAMPLSWLPLISDYTKDARKPRAASAVSAAVYFLTGCWMYIIGLGAALFTGESDIAQIMVTAGLGIIAVLIVILSTVTTTFLDVYSAGVSFRTVTNRIPEKAVSIAVCVLGTLLAIFTPITEYENFLYLIGSVFAPMISILIVDYFILRQKHDREPLNRTNAVLWLVGFCVYRLFLSVDTVIGSTFPVMLITALLCVLVHRIRRRFPV